MFGSQDGSQGPGDTIDLHRALRENPAMARIPLVQAFATPSITNRCLMSERPPGFVCGLKSWPESILRCRCFYFLDPGCKLMLPEWAHYTHARRGLGSRYIQMCSFANPAMLIDISTAVYRADPPCKTGLGAENSPSNLLCTIKKSMHAGIPPAALQVGVPLVTT